MATYTLVYLKDNEKVLSKKSIKKGYWTTLYVVSDVINTAKLSHNDLQGTEHIAHATCIVGLTVKITWLKKRGTVISFRGKLKLEKDYRESAAPLINICGEYDFGDNHEDDPWVGGDFILIIEPKAQS